MGQSIIPLLTGMQHGMSGGKGGGKQGGMGGGKGGGILPQLMQQIMQSQGGMQGQGGGMPGIPQGGGQPGGMPQTMQPMQGGGPVPSSNSMYNPQSGQFTGQKGTDWLKQQQQGSPMQRGQAGPSGKPPGPDPKTGQPAQMLKPPQKKPMPTPGGGLPPLNSGMTPKPAQGTSSPPVPGGMTPLGPGGGVTASGSAAAPQMPQGQIPGAQGGAPMQAAMQQGGMPMSNLVMRTGNPGMTRADKNFNPGNIMAGSFARGAGATGQAGMDQGHGVATFPNYQAGFDAINKLIQGSGYAGQGRNNLNSIMSKYSPSNPQAAGNIGKTMGVSPNQKLDFSNPQVRRAFDKGLATQEGAPNAVKWLNQQGQGKGPGIQAMMSPQNLRAGSAGNPNIESGAEDIPNAPGEKPKWEGGDHKALWDMASAAIAQGAPHDKVMQRMQELMSA